MLELLEQQKRLTTNQKKIVAAAVIGDMLDYFDFGLMGFALAFIVGPWHLTYGQSAMILLTSGIGGVPGALFYGWLADRIGRRTVFIITALNFSLATGVMALTPDYGGWIFLSVCRFFVGFGVLPPLELLRSGRSGLCRKRRYPRYLVALRLGRPPRAGRDHRLEGRFPPR
jgi:MFS transporter, putative metabolite:H+ symporter